jgi:hypothetical protein
MTLRQTHFLDLDLSGRELFLAENDGERDACDLGSFELLREFWFEFVCELGLFLLVRCVLVS